MTIDPLLSLALNMHSSKGVYALLVGSGVSRSAKIPTGWEVVLDLIRRLAKLKGEDCGDDPAAWFRKTFGEEPDYAKLLDQLTTSPEQRQQVLRGYFEPTDEERADGLKQPTAAHKAIARLVAGGYVRVILTTNFDKLLEQAIQEAGVPPTVISTPDGIAGAMPLTHQRCVVVKLHGDYLDVRIKNTPAELDVYEKAVEGWLDRIFDEFGLIIAGWSGEWDTALRRSIERCSTRRFGFWWASVGDPRSAAISLTGVRGGSVIRIVGADQFFQDLADKVEVLDDIYPDHPVNVATSVALVKRFLGEPRQPIKLADLVSREADRATAEMRKDQDKLLANPDRSLYEPFISRCISQTGTLRQVVATAAFWGGDATVRAVTRSIVRLAHDPTGAVTHGSVLNNCFRLPQAVAVLYAAMLGHVAGGDFVSAANVAVGAKVSDRSDQSLKSILLLYHHDYENVRRISRSVARVARAFFPMSELLVEALRPEMATFFAEPASYEIAFGHVELVLALTSGHLANADVSNLDRVWTLPGRFMYRDAPNDPLFLRDAQGDELEWCKQQQPFVALIAAGHFGGDWKRLVAIRRSLAVNAHHWTRGL